MSERLLLKRRTEQYCAKGRKRQLLLKEKQSIQAETDAEFKKAHVPARVRELNTSPLIYAMRILSLQMTFCKEIDVQEIIIKRKKKEIWRN